MNPVATAIVAISGELTSALRLDEVTTFRALLEPTDEKYGDLSFPAIRYTKDVKGLAEDLRKFLSSKGLNYVSVEQVQGFLNFRFMCPGLASATIAWLQSDGNLDVIKAEKVSTVVVEHTSANPIHPLHIGHTRNACIGDSLVRLLRARGHRVISRYYVDDMGRQMAIVALGVRLLGGDLDSIITKTNRKPDYVIGWIYAVTSTTVDLMAAKAKGDQDEASKLASALVRLKSQDPIGVFDQLYNSILSLNDPEKAISEINSRYESGLEPERSFVRSIANAVLRGFTQSLNRLGVSFDEWDWESDLVWKGLVKAIVDEIKASRFYTKHKGADAIDVPMIIKEVLINDPEAMKSIQLPRGLEIPPLVVLRSDGTSLYTTRDLAYSLYKFSTSGADRVINVIGADQRLPQLQLRLALLGLGHRKEAINMFHYDYEAVRLPTGSMHGRRGEYVTLDETLETAKARALEEVRSRNPQVDSRWAEEVAEKVAVGAVRFAMVQVSASKPLVFDLSKALNLKENSGPYLQYTRVRALGILEKHGPIDYGAANPEACSEQLRSLMLSALRFPLVAAKAADDLAPELLASYLLSLADRFNNWYEKDAVIREQDVGARELKAIVVALVEQALRRGLELLGVPTPDRM